MKLLPSVPVALLAFASPALAQDALIELAPITVIGSEEQLFELPGSGYVVTADEIRELGTTNVNRVFAKIPGVYTREENGSGNFPNISIRGVDGTRSEKVTIMEDGILQAPAPYSAPSAYYSPKIARMSGVEVLKGSSQVRYGPNTTGGVVNFLSTVIPDEQTFYTRNTYGTDNTFFSHTYFGDTIESEAGRFGYLVELFHNQSDGFRTIDAGFNGAVSGGQDTGFTVTEPMLKLFWEPNGPVDQRFEFKYGRTDFNADESYTGLTESDVRSDPDRRYAATAWDNIDTEQERLYFKHIIRPNDDFRLETAVYYNRFRRNWFKLDDADGAGFGSVRQALLVPAGVDLLQGRGTGALTIRNNNRRYESYGVQTAAEWSFETGNIDHTLSFGARYHTDYVRRQQGDRDITVVAGTITNQTDEIFGQQGNRRQESDALALWAEDKIEIGSLTLRPGVRYERIEQSFQEFGRTPGVDLNQPLTGANDRGSDTIDYFAPGIGFSYSVTDNDEVFGGIYKGFSVPSPRSSIQSGTDFEESIGYELGYRMRREGLRAELVGFLTDFDNLFAAAAGTNSPFDQLNGGEATVAGVELLVQYDPMERCAADFRLPMYVSATYTNAEFDRPLGGGGGDNIFAGAEDGSEIPYVPEFKLAAGVGYENDVWGVAVDTTYVTSTFTTGENVDSPDQAGFGHFARAGKTDPLFITDLNAHYQVTDNIKLVGGVANVFDQRGIVSRLARGPRANNGRTAYFGFEAKF